MADENTQAAPANTPVQSAEKPAESSLLGGETTDTSTQDTALLSDEAAQKPAADQKPAEEKKPETPVVPEKYEFKAPEGMELDAKAVEAFSPVAKELGLTQEAAQKIVDLYAAQVKGQSDAALKSTMEMRANWRKEVLSSPTAKDDIAFAKKGLAKAVADDPEAKELFTGPASWLSDHPAVVRTFARLGRMLGEAVMHEEGAAGGTQKVSDADLMYPNMKK